MIELRNDNVNLEKVVAIVEMNLGISELCYPYIQYCEPFEFYLRSNTKGSILKFSSEKLLQSCNSQIIQGEPYFKDVEDMMDEFGSILGGDPLELVVKKLKENPAILACVKK